MGFTYFGCWDLLWGVFVHVLILGFAFSVNGTDGKNAENTFVVESNKFLKDPVFYIYSTPTNFLHPRTLYKHQISQKNLSIQNQTLV